MGARVDFVAIDRVCSQALTFGQIWVRLVLVQRWKTMKNPALQAEDSPALGHWARGSAPGGGDQQAGRRARDEVDAARAQEYALLATILTRSPDAQLLARLAQLRGDASPLGKAHAALAHAAAAGSAVDVGREYFDLFVGMARGEVLPYASYYLTGFLFDRPLARLRQDLQRLGIEQSEGQCEPEDHAATLCEIMSGLAAGQWSTHEGAEREMFERHLAPWMGRFFADLEQAPSARFYAGVGTLGRTFMAIEGEAFARTL
jgi:TorA maturation chaperone TorD